MFAHQQESSPQISRMRQLADGGLGDGGLGDGGLADGGLADGGLGDGGLVDGGLADGGLADGGLADGGLGDGGLADGGLADGGLGDGGLADGGLADGGLADGGLADGGLADGGLADGGLADGGLADGGLADGGLGDGGLADVLKGTPTLPASHVPPLAVSMDQNSAVVLPLVSDNKKLIWVQTLQIDLQLDGAAAQLDEAFDRFPYLTPKQTADLAQRCSLHPDQVKVWFMAQRLRCGISWDYKDIVQVRRTFKSSRGNGKKERMGGEVEEDGRKTQKRKVKETGEVGSAEEGQNVAANEQLAGKMKIEKDIEEDGTLKKCKRKSVKAKTGKTRKKEDDEGVMETERRARASGSVEVETGRGLEGEATDQRVFVTDVDKLKELIELNDGDAVADGQQDSSTPTSQIRSRARTRAQMALMKTAFRHCQYPDGKEYCRLAALTGVPRVSVVQWFGDMRYYMKRGRPRWMSEQQHRQALANILYRQHVGTLARLKKAEGDAACEMKPEEDGGVGGGGGGGEATA